MAGDAQRASSFGEVAEQYHSSRPSYPAELVDDLLAAGRRVLDVGCGTGIAGALFVQRGCHVVGVEQDARMAEVARRQGLEVAVSRFEDWEPPEEPFDLLISAQAWHWIDPVIGPAKAGRMLRPGGTFAAFWNRYSHEAAVFESLADVHRRLAPELLEDSVPLGTMPPARELSNVDALMESGLFEARAERRYGWERRYSRDQWLAELATHSRHRVLPPDLRAPVLAEVGEVVDRHGGTIVVTMSTDVVTAVRRGAPQP